MYGGLKGWCTENVQTQCRHQNLQVCKCMNTTLGNRHVDSYSNFCSTPTTDSDIGLTVIVLCAQSQKVSPIQSEIHVQMMLRE